MRLGKHGLVLTDRTVEFASPPKRKKVDPPPACSQNPWSQPSSSAAQNATSRFVEEVKDPKAALQSGALSETGQVHVNLSSPLSNTNFFESTY